MIEVHSVRREPGLMWLGRGCILVFFAGILLSGIARAQSSGGASSQSGAAVPASAIEQRLNELQSEIDELRAQLAAAKALPRSAERGAGVLADAGAPTHSSPAVAGVVAGEGLPTSAQNSRPGGADASPAEARPQMPVLPGGSTLNVMLDGYYAYNFNHPADRSNALHAYDVSSNSFSLNQAAVVFELPTDVENHRRFGLRFDMQFGQATATLQGNPANEARPEVYRNVFQVYGRYVAPVGHGLTVDFGKWASSLGYEGNYTKDQLNYSRSFYFNYLPYYHMGLRATYPVNSKLALNYWAVNGAQQTETVNNFHDQLAGFVLTPTSTITWTSNYYFGQEHPDTVPATNCTVPLQPGLCAAPIVNPANGRLHILDNYVAWQARPSLLFALEADYVIQRQWQHASAGQSSAPSRVGGYAAYAQYQFNSRLSVAARNEYLSDRGGLFSGATQALKEGTVTLRYNVGDGFSVMTEYRRDWSNQRYFPTGAAGLTRSHQDIATVGLVWWYGNKQGSW